MIYLVQEEYGHYYESGWNTLIGYTSDFEFAKSKVKELEEAYRLANELQDTYNETHDRLCDEIVLTGADSEYDLVEERMKELGFEEMSMVYAYDYYWVTIKEVPELEKISND